jgi:hypothetical protein
MKESIHIKLLYKLKNEGVATLVPIESFIQSNFENKTNKGFVDYDMRSELSFLRDLIKRELIEHPDGDIYLNTVENMGFPNNRRFDDILIKVFITSKGLDYLENYENNKRSERLYTGTVVNIILTFILSCLMLLVAYQSLKTANNALNESKKPDAKFKLLHTVK